MHTDMRTSNALWFILLLLAFDIIVKSEGSSMKHVTRSICGEDTLLHCLAMSKSGVQYRSVIWYKVSDSPSRQLTGLLMKRLTHNSTVQRYKGVERDLILLEDSLNLVLPNVTLQDSGRYRCFLSAPIGHQNQEGEIYLRVYEGLNVENEPSAEQDTLLAISLLTVSIVLLFVSYTCLQYAIISYKNRFSNKTAEKVHQMKQSFLKMESKRSGCTILPQEYV